MDGNQKLAELDPVITLDDAANFASVHRDTLRRCGRRGDIDIVQISPRRIGIRKSELRRWLDSRAAA